MLWKQRNKLIIQKVYKNISDRIDLKSKLAEKIFKSLNGRGFISEKQLKYFLFDFKKVLNLGKFYLSHKIGKRLFTISGRPVITNCGTPTGN